MASVRSTIDLLIIGATRGLSSAAAEARRTAERIAAAEDQVAAARRRSAESESRVADVEARLEGARARHTAALSQVGVAETNLARVRDASNGATTRLGEAENRLEALRQGGASAETIARAEADIARVRTEADSAAANLQRAEAQLERARANATARAGEITALEERLAQARGRAFRDSEALAQAEERLRLARSRGTDDLNRQRDGILGVFDALRNLGQAFSGADGASTSFIAKLGALQQVISRIGGPIVQAVVGLVEFAAVMGAIGEIVGVVGGLIGQALAGVPALLLAIGAAAGTVALGMDGIKKAAEVLKAPFEALKKVVSDTFTRELTPAFTQLAGVLPRFTASFRFIAESLSGIAKQVIAFVASAKGIETINGVLRGTALLFQGLAPGIAAFVRGLLEAADVGRTAFSGLGIAIGSVFARLGEVFTRLAGDGTIARAVQGLSATITGLGAVIGPVVELFIRMGAALGNSVGVALESVGAGIRQVIPFFEKLAQVAGQLLVEAVKQLGPPLSELVQSILPGASQGMDGFAAVVKNVVLPAIAGFINWLRTDGIPGIVAFTRGAIVQFLEFATGVTSAVSGILSVLSAFFKTLAVAAAGTPLQKTFLDAAAAAEGAKVQVDGLTSSLNEIKSKVVAFKVEVPSDRTTGEQGVLGVAAAMDRAAVPRSTAFTVQVPSDRTTGEQGILGVVAAQAQVTDKTTTTTANVPSAPLVGEQGILGVVAANARVADKTTTTTTNVPSGPTTGTQGNQALKGSIDAVYNKSVVVRADVQGESAVRSLISAIAAVHDKTVTVISNVINNVTKAFADGGRVPVRTPFLVGERGPELLTLDGRGGVISTASRTRQVLAESKRAPDGAATPVSLGGGDAPITVNVMLSQDQIAGIAQVEIARQNRATKRTVLAGSGVTF